MLSKYIAFSLLASLASASSPVWCTPPKIATYSTYTWDDESSVCQSQGIGTNCCSTFVEGGGTCPKFSDASDVADLENALGQQIAKDGYWEGTTVGNWVVTFGESTSAIPNRDVISPWFKGIQDLQANPPSYSIGDIYFSLDGNTIIAAHTC